MDDLQDDALLSADALDSSLNSSLASIAELRESLKNDSSPSSSEPPPSSSPPVPSSTPRKLLRNVIASSSSSASSPPSPSTSLSSLPSPPAGSASSFASSPSSQPLSASPPPSSDLSPSALHLRASSRSRSPRHSGSQLQDDVSSSDDMWKDQLAYLQELHADTPASTLLDDDSKRGDDCGTAESDDAEKLGTESESLAAGADGACGECPCGAQPPRSESERGLPEAEEEAEAEAADWWEGLPTVEALGRTWVQVLDRGTSSPYYVDVRTGETRWDVREDGASTRDDGEGTAEGGHDGAGAELSFDKEGDDDDDDDDEGESQSCDDEECGGEGRTVALSHLPADPQGPKLLLSPPPHHPDYAHLPQSTIYGDFHQIETVIDKVLASLDESVAASSTAATPSLPTPLPLASGASAPFLFSSSSSKAASIPFPPPSSPSSSSLAAALRRPFRQTSSPLSSLTPPYRTSFRGDHTARGLSSPTRRWKPPSSATRHAPTAAPSGVELELEEGMVGDGEGGALHIHVKKMPKRLLEFLERHQLRLRIDSHLEPLDAASKQHDGSETDQGGSESEHCKWTPKPANGSVKVTPNGCTPVPLLKGSACSESDDCSSGSFSANGTTQRRTPASTDPYSHFVLSPPIMSLYLDAAKARASQSVGILADDSDGRPAPPTFPSALSSDFPASDNPASSLPSPLPRARLEDEGGNDDDDDDFNDFTPFFESGPKGAGGIGTVILGVAASAPSASAPSSSPVAASCLSGGDAATAPAEQQQQPAGSSFAMHDSISLTGEQLSQLIAMSTSHGGTHQVQVVQAPPQPLLPPHPPSRSKALPVLSLIVVVLALLNVLSPSSELVSGATFRYHKFDPRHLGSVIVSKTILSIAQVLTASPSPADEVGSLFDPVRPTFLVRSASDGFCFDGTVFRPCDSSALFTASGSRFPSFAEVVSAEAFSSPAPRRCLSSNRRSVLSLLPCPSAAPPPAASGKRAPHEPRLATPPSSSKDAKHIPTEHRPTLFSYEGMVLSQAHVVGGGSVVRSCVSRGGKGQAFVGRCEEFGYDPLLIEAVVQWPEEAIIKGSAADRVLTFLRVRSLWEGLRLGYRTVSVKGFSEVMSTDPYSLYDESFKEERSGVGSWIGLGGADNGLLEGGIGSLFHDF